MKTGILRAILLALAMPCAAAAPAQPAPAQLTAEQWREDLRFMKAEMERRHANLYHQVERDAFEAAVADLDRRIPTLERHKIVVGMMRIAALVGDGHSRVDPRKDPKFGFPSLPVKLFLFDDGLFVRAARPDHAALVGARIEAIGGVPVAEAIRRVGEIASSDNASGAKLFVPLYLAMPDVLHALGLSDRRDRAMLTVGKGKRRWTASLAAGAVDPPWPPDTDISLVTPPGWSDARATPAPPLWLQALLDYHRLVELPGALYVQLNMVSDIEGQTLEEFARKIGARAAATNPRALVLDLRLDHGGNGNLRRELIRQLIRAEDGDTRLFVLTARGTFSASQFILDDLDRLTDAIFIGEPAGSKPSSYGDAYRTPMPNSGIAVRSSIVWWQQGQNFDPWTWIDLAPGYNFADYAAGRDPALEAALAYSPEPPLATQLGEADRAAGTAAALALLDRHRRDPRHRFRDFATIVPTAAETLYHAGHKAAGLAIAERALREYPASLDAAIVAAFLAEAAGRPDLAREAADRTLRIDPNNRGIRPLLDRLARPAR